MTYLRKYLALFICVIIPGSIVIFAQSDVIISLPIPGEFLVAQSSENLLSINTVAGDVSYFNLPEGRVLLPAFNSDGTQLVYGRLRYDHSVVDVGSQNYVGIEVYTGLPSDDLFVPRGWSLDDTNILYVGDHFISNGTSESIYTFYLFDVENELLSAPELSLTTGMILPPSVILPDEVSSAYLINMPNIHRNPMYDNWISLEMDIVNQALLNNLGDPDTRQPDDGQTMILLWNYLTDEMIVVNDLLSERILRNPIWSEDGKRLSLETPSGDTYLINFTTGQTNSISLDKQTDSVHRIQHWLGVDDLLITFRVDDATDYRIFSIGQIIDGNWYETEFFRLSGTEYSGITVGGSDWRLTATQEEQYQLSCLFDQAIPVRIAIGQRARVNFTDGTPLRLRTEPDFSATEIMQMSEGTEFEIIGGSACVNGSDYYRFWQLQLDDDTIGWAAEASTTDYFIEPVQE